MPQTIGRLDEIIGRTGEIDRVRQLLTDHRLVTLTGTGGCGKTRLAHAVAASIAGDGRVTHFVDLSSIASPVLIGSAALVSLGLDPASGRHPLDVVIESLADHECLLVLDNLEQIDRVGDVVLRMLGEATAIRILATSRRPLSIPGEVEFAVPTLESPASSALDAIEASPAGSLFLTRAHAIGRLESLDDDTAMDLCTLLKQLDGLPLAIELAAARTRLLTPAEIIRRLDTHGLSAIDRPVKPEERSLQGILDWTLDLLDDDQREILEAVSVCAGFDLAMAEALTPNSDALAGVEDLIALGLVATAGTVDGVTRFRLLETIRAGVQQNMEPGRLAVFRNRHADECLAIAAAWFSSSSPIGPEQIHRFDAEADNMRRALDRFAEVAPRRALDLLRLLEDFWATRGRMREWYDRLRQLATQTPEPSIELARAIASVQAAWQVIPTRDLRALSDKAVELAHQVSDRPALVRALLQRAIIAVNDNDRATGESIVAELELIDDNGLDARSRRELAAARASVSGALLGRASDEHVVELRSYMEVASTPRWVLNRANAAVNLSGSLLARAEYDEAAELAAEAAAAYRSYERQEDEVNALAALATALAGGGYIQKAVDATLRCAELAIESRSSECRAAALWTAICVTSTANEPVLAGRLWGNLMSLETHDDVTLSEFDRNLVEMWIRGARKKADAIAFEVALRDGESQDTETLLRSLASSLTAVGRPVGKVGELRHGELSRREVEILALVGSGKSDPEIAEALVISPKTASVHVANVKAKLGLKSRLEVALKARELGLVE